MGLWKAIKMIDKGTVLTAKVAVTGVRVAAHLTSATVCGTAATLKTVNQAMEKATEWAGYINPRRLLTVPMMADMVITHTSFILRQKYL